ncbi:AcrR family transcriptional regulator [Peribacillus deserti]|uniref:AcrR family transcriptional regulator n=1 Tax=Peribacillus deserti TaxID=673318 RepID=A0ABS2QDW4_9BACI|nr:TetR/AcrR family transcriptional regulator [Peribacillus deserti]MBM7691353.1 AcrR family transcriptional regulator [Peribacillus deserti]
MNTSTALLIKETALEHFALKGFESTSMREIAKDIGLTMSMLESYYSNKADIFLSVFDFLAKFYTNFLEEIIVKTKGLPLKERVCEITLAVTGNACNHRTACLFWKRIIFFPPETIKSELTQKFQEMLHCILQALTSVFKDAVNNNEIKDEDPSLLASSLFDIINGLNIRLYMNNKVPYEREARFLCSAFCREISR